MRCGAGSEGASPDPNGLALDPAISCVFNDHISINSKELAFGRVDIHDNGPVTIDSDIFAINRQPALRPLRDIAPVSHEVFLDELSRRLRAEIPAVNGSDFGGLEVRPVFGAGAELESSVTICIIMVVFSVDAGALVEVTVGPYEEVGAGQRLSGPARSNLVELAVEGVVELEADGWIGGLHVAGRAHGEVVKVKAGEPPDVVDPACDVWCGVGLLGRDHRVFLVAQREEGVDEGVRGRCFRHEIYGAGDLLCFHADEVEEADWCELVECDPNELDSLIAGNGVIPACSAGGGRASGFRGEVLVVEGNSSGTPLPAIEGSSSEAAIQIIQDFLLWPAHVQPLPSDISEADLGNVHFLNSVGEEQWIIAVRAGLNTVGVARVVVESDIVDADVTHPGSDDSPGVGNSLRVVGLCLADYHRVLEDCQIFAEVGDPELSPRSLVFGTGEVRKD